MVKSKSKTNGYLLAIESSKDDEAVPTELVQTMLQQLLEDHGYDVLVDIEAMGEIDCYEPNE